MTMLPTRDRPRGATGRHVRMGTQNTGPGRLILRPIAGCSGNIADRGVGRRRASHNVTRERPKTALVQVTPIAGTGSFIWAIERKEADAEKLPL
jgi:hypothetical protein